MGPWESVPATPQRGRGAGRFGLAWHEKRRRGATAVKIGVSSYLLIAMLVALWIWRHPPKGGKRWNERATKRKGAGQHLGRSFATSQHLSAAGELLGAWNVAKTGKQAVRCRCDTGATVIARR
jgi:hypothetical protein